MKAKAPLYFLVLVLALIAGISTGCTKNPLGSSRNDAQIASDVQNKVFSDSNVQSRQISVQSANGVVTLAGNVNSDAERTAAANDAAQIEGVKTVVNNLQVQSAASTPSPAVADQQAQNTPPPVAEPARRSSSRPSSTRATTSRGTSRTHDYSEPVANSSSNDSNATGGGIGSSSGSSMASSTPAVPVPQKVTIPDGTTLSIRLIDGLDSEKNQPGDTFRATLNAPIVINDDVVIPQGADVEGRVVDVKSAGRFAGQSILTLELTKLDVNGRTYNLHSDQWSKSGNGRGKATAAKVGGGAALGAIIGGIAGGGKGAAIGATVGAGAGTGVSAATKGQQIALNSEALLSFKLESPLTVTAQSKLNRNNRSDSSNQ
jgi:BON domain